MSAGFYLKSATAFLLGLQGRQRMADVVEKSCGQGASPQAKRRRDLIPPVDLWEKIEWQQSGSENKV